MENIKIIIELLTASLSPVVAITVAYIAYQQWNINASKEAREVRHVSNNCIQPTANAGAVVERLTAFNVFSVNASIPMLEISQP